MKVLNGKTVVVTGAASGIGLALAARFGDEGMNVVLADIEDAALGRAVAQLADAGVNVMGVVTDVSRPESVDALARKGIERFGSVQIVCNNAGVGGHHYPIWEVPLSYWEWIVSVNLRGVIHGIRSFVPLLLEQREGHIVNTASVAGLIAIPYIGPYVATKHAVMGISTTLFHELAAIGSPVKVSVLCPGAVDTRFADADRNWPSQLGAPPTSSDDPRAQSVHEVVRAGVRVGLPPARVAQLVIDAIYAERFLVLTESEFAARAVHAFTEAVEGRPPVLPRLR
jgi:NAD(P)-dependent dehydrogenase (short-subunit alcohol dehydrogenase family)